MVQTILNENEGNDIEISFISKVKYLSISYLLKRYKIKQKNNIITLYDSNNEITLKMEDICNIHMEDGILYIGNDDYKINLIIKNQQPEYFGENTDC